MPKLLLHPLIVFAALLTLSPFLLAGFWPRSLQPIETWPRTLRVCAPAALAVPYVLVAKSSGLFRWSWFALYFLLPVLISLLLQQAAEADPGQKGEWRDYLILFILGLAVDLRWFEPAWGPGLAVFNKMLLLDAGIYGFLAIRRLSRAGFNLRLRLRDWGIGMLWLLVYIPVAAPLGLWLGFLHFHPQLPSPAHVLLAWIFTFFFIAVPEELFFRGWMQNLLERRMGPMPALLLTATLFGLSHFNKRARHFNWQYVVLAALAGVVYGRAWLHDRRVGASAITHASVDTIWSVWLR